MSNNGITRPDLWEKALNTISPGPKPIVGILAIYEIWREYWRLLKEADKT